MYEFEMFLGRYPLEPVMGTFSLVSLILVIPHFFIDMLLVTQYAHGQSDFQRFYLCVHWVGTILALTVLTYGFFALNAKSYHAISNLRSWTLFSGLLMFFSGFFSIIGFALDWHLFKAQCLEDFEELGRDGTNHVTLQDLAGCKSIFDALLTTHAVLWAITEACMMTLFLNINSYKVTRFADEERERREKLHRRLAERNREMGVREAEAEEEEAEDESERTLTADEEEEVFAYMGRQMKREAEMEKLQNHRSIRFAFPEPPNVAHVSEQRPPSIVQSHDYQQNSIEFLAAARAPPPRLSLSPYDHHIELPRITVESPNGTGQTPSAVGTPPYTPSTAPTPSSSNPLRPAHAPRANPLHHPFYVHHLQGQAF